MRRTGLIFLAAGLAAFLVASGISGRTAGIAWDDARWVVLGVAVMGLVLVLFPGKKG